MKIFTKLLRLSAFFLLTQFCFQTLEAQNVTIVESLSGAPWDVQDTIWYDVAINLGYTPEIVQQSALDNISNFDNTDILIIASGIISYTGTNHLQTIYSFVESGRPIYVQAEYLNTFQGNITFQSLMSLVGANFAWTSAISGQLVPMNILGSFATTPNQVDSLMYFNYGYSGSGTDVEPFMEYQGNYFGFYFYDSLSCYGGIITNTDEDWVWHATSLPLMENIMYRLEQSSAPNYAIITDPSDITINADDNASFFTGISGGSPTYQWQVNSGGGWSNLTNTGIYFGADNALLQLDSVPGSYDGYQYRCITAFLCSGDTSDQATLTVIPNTSIEESFITAMHIFPNPSNGSFEISFNHFIAEGKIQIFNMLGDKIFEEIISGKLRIHLTNISSGVYFVKLSDGENHYLKKMLIE